MSNRAYAESYQKLMTEHKPQVEAAFKVATKVAMNHRLSNVQGDDCEAYPIIDMLTLEGQTVDKGEEEIVLFLDSVLIEALIAYEYSREVQS